MVRRYHANNFSTTTTASITAAATTIPIASSTGLPDISGGGTYRLTLSAPNGAREIVIVTARSSLDLTVTRGAESTTAQVFSSGSTVSLRETADSFDRKADGAASSTDNALARYDSTSGLILQNSGTIVDDDGNLSTNNLKRNYTTVATAAGTTTLTAASTGQQFFTGSTTQTVVLPVVTTLTLGHSFYIVNNSSDVVTVQSSGANTVQAMAANTFMTVTCIAITGTTAASWSVAYSASGGGGGTPGGSTTQVQYNNAGSFAGHSGFTYDGSGTATTTTALTTPTLNATTAAIIGGNSTAGGYMRLLEDSDNGSNYTGFQAPASLAGNVMYTLPTADGPSGYVLSTNGSGTLSWEEAAAGGGGGAFQLIGSATASSSASLTFTSLGDYSAIHFVFVNVKPASDAVAFYMRTSTNNGSSYDSGASDYSYALHFMPASGVWGSNQSSAAAQIQLNGSVIGNSTGEKVCGFVDLYGPAATDYSMISGQVNTSNASTVLYVTTCSGMRLTSADVDAVQFLFQSGNIASGTIYAYGKAKSNSGSGLNDGDYGDITVASGGTVITVDTPSSTTIATDDKVLVKDTSASDVMRYVTTQNIRDLVPGSGTLTSAQLATSLTDETGTGAAVFASSPTLVTPALGTPSSGVLTNCTGLPVAGGGTGIATTTAYSVICAGTTATGAFQSLASLGTAGAILTSNGAGALPSFKGGKTSLYAYCSTSQSIPATTFTKVQMNTEVFDTGAMFDSSTNYRYTPTIAGYYFVYVAVVVDANLPNGVFTLPNIYKNGSSASQGIFYAAGASNSYGGGGVGTMVYLNGSTDYIEAYIYHNDTVSRTLLGGAQYTFISAVLLEPA